MAKRPTPQAKEPAAPRVKPKGAPRVMPRSTGRKPWKPNDEQKMFVMANSGRATQETIAKTLGITVETLVKHCRAELNAGVEVADAHVEGALFRECMKGNVTAIIWRDKTRRKMKEILAHEISGRDGAPIEHDHKVSAKEAAELFKQELG